MTTKDYLIIWMALMNTGIVTLQILEARREGRKSAALCDQRRREAEERGYGLYPVYRPWWRGGKYWRDVQTGAREPW